MKNYKKDGIAIVGMAFRLPGNLSTPEEFWEALKNEQDLITAVDDSRWSISRYLHPRKSERGKSYTFSSGMLSRIDEFDANFFGISPREASQMDPQQRCLLETTWEALENGCQNPEKLAGSDCAVYIGIGSNEYQYRYVNDLSSISSHTMLGTCPSIASNRISYVFDLHGPSMSIDTACSSSMVALHQACQSIWNGEASTAIVGGINMLLSPSSFIGFAKASMLSPDGFCKSFDADGNGYVRSEGCVVLFLKPLDAAEKEGDPIHAVILNSGVNSDGRTNGIALPSVDAQAALISQVHKKAGVTADDISYVEAHGTGTAIGDPIEAQAIGAAISKHRTVSNPLLVGSVKSNIGHLEVASGLAGIVKALLCFKHEAIPATLHFKTPNPNIDFEQLNLKVVDQFVLFPKKNTPKVIAINSFGFGGTNAHVVLAEYISSKTQRESKQPHQLIPPLVLSAQHEKVLPKLAAQYCKLLKEKHHDYYDVAYTLAVRRQLQNTGMVVEGNNIETIIDTLEQISADKAQLPSVFIGQCFGKQLAVALVYSGNGSQWQGMGQQLLAKDPLFKLTVEEIDSLFVKYADFSIKKELLAATEDNRYHLTEIAQPCLFALQVAITKYLMRHGVQVEAVLGHSVGEITAAWACGALTLEQAVQVIYERSFWQGKTRGNGRMAAVSLSVEDAEKLIIDLNLQQELEVAAINSPNGTTVAGKLTALEQLQLACNEKNIFYRILELDYAFHSQQMESIKVGVINALATLKPQRNSIRYISTVTGSELAGKKLDTNYWWQNIRQPVKFYDAINTLINDGVKVFIEVGPHPIMKRYVDDTLASKEVHGVVITTARRYSDEYADVKAALFKTWLSGAKFDIGVWFPQIGTAVPLPSYPWIKESYWLMPSSESNNQFELKIEHPLLGYRVKSDEPVWENHLDTILVSYLGDHVVDGSAVMPAAGYAEMALAASKLWYGHSCHDVQDIEILVPMAFEAEYCRIVHFSLQLTDGSFDIKSRIRHSDEPWVTHAVGRLLGEPAYHANKKINIVEYKNVATTQLSGREHYFYAEKVGLIYGATFQNISNIWMQDSNALASIQLHADVAASVDQYCLHPALLDTCFQMLIGLIGNYSSDQQAMLPVRLGRVRVLGQFENASYIVAQIIKKNKQTILAKFSIVDAEGVVIAEIDDCRFKSTQFTNHGYLAKTYIYQPHLLSSYELRQVIVLDDLKLMRNSVEIILAQRDVKRASHFNAVMPLFDVMIGQFVLYAIKKLVGDVTTFSVEQLCLSAQILKEQQNLLKCCIKILLEDDYLKQTSVDQFSFMPVQEDMVTAETIWTTLLHDHPNYLSELAMVGRCCRHLKDILCGDIKLEEILNSTRKSATLEHLLEGAPSAIGGDDVLCEAVGLIAAKWPSNRRLRVLEIGAGVGSVTKQLLGLLPANKTDYWFAVQNDAALVKAKFFAANYDFVKVVQLNLNEQFKKRGELTDQRFDMVIFRNCLHQVDDVYQTLGELKGILTTDAILLVEERYCDRMHEIVFGIEPNWWQSQNDGQLLPRLVSAKTWQQVLAQSGFAIVEPLYELAAAEFEGAFVLMAQPLNVEEVTKAEGFNFDWLVLADSVSAVTPLIDALKTKQQSVFVATTQAMTTATEFSFDPNQLESVQQLLAPFANKPNKLRIVQLIGVNSGLQKLDGQTLMAYQDRCNAVIHLVKAIENLTWASYPQLTIVTDGGVLCHADVESVVKQDTKQAPLWGLGRVLMNEHPELQCKLIDLQCTELTQLMAANFVAELCKCDAENEIIITPFARYGLRVVSTEIQVPSFDHHQDFRLDFLKAGPLKNLKWFPIPERPLAEDEVMIKPRASGLNFRDVMYAMGLIPDEAVEDGFLGATLGMEFAGEVVALGQAVTDFSVGDSVMGFAPASFSSRAITKAHAITRLPKNWSFSAAAGVPIAFFTAYYALLHLARIQTGERLLIHGAAGGVGIAAIQLAHYLGVEVYATAGSDEKRDFLALMGVEHIYDSRSLAFADQIMEQTNGEGIDVVLNCLAGEAINSNLAIMKPFGRFLELGKRDFYANSKIGLRPFRNNISYFGIDADQLIIKNPTLSARLFKEIVTLFEQDVLTPLPYREFAIDDIGDAFRCMQQSRHIGKIIVSFEQQPQINFAENKLAQPLILDGEATYLVTGGLSGFGLRTAQWLVDKGARHLVLVGRSGVVTEEATSAIKAFTTRGINVHVKALDITDTEAVNKMMQEIQQQMFPLRGIIHAAAVFDDGLIRNLNVERMQKVLAPKMLGAWNLHNSTLDISLDFFVVYSSATTLFGNPGQANYVAANAYLESLISMRRSLGLPGLYVAWGAIDDVGYLARHQNIKEILMSKLGARALTAAQALTLLEKLILFNYVGVSVSDLNIRSMQRFMPGTFSSKFERLLLNDSNDGDSNSREEIDIRTLIADKSQSEVLTIVTEILTQEIARILHLAAEKIDINESLLNIGMDSLMGAELANAIVQRFTVHIPMMVLSQGPTIHGIAKRITKQLCKNETEVNQHQHNADVENIIKIAAQHGEDLTQEVAYELVLQTNQQAQKDESVTP